MDMPNYDESFPEVKNLEEYWEPDFSSVKAGNEIIVYTETDNLDEWISIDPEYIWPLDEER